MNRPESESYEYQPLPDSKTSIRLLSLLPSRSKSIVEGKLMEIAFPPQQAYSALSYEWGLDHHSHSIEIDGHTLKIGRNLSAFLSELCAGLLNGETLVVWADAICIDQRSTSEKNDQVRMMGDIYSQARDVVSWLGDDGGIQRLFQCITDYCGDQSSTAIAEKDVQMNLGQIMNNSPLLTEYPGYHGDLAVFYGAEYFQRAWIIQELILAPSLSFRCGSSHLSHECLLVLVNKVRFQNVSTGLAKLDTILRQYLERQEAGYEKSAERLGRLMELYAYTKCSNPHDKVYAFVGAARDLRSSFVVEYDKPLHQLAMETIVHDISGPRIGWTRYFSFLNRLFSHVLTFDSETEATHWTSAMVSKCRQFPQSMLDCRIVMCVQLEGKVVRVEGSTIFIDRMYGGERGDLVCRLLYGSGEAGDRVFSSRLLCFIYRWNEGSVTCVGIGVHVSSPWCPMSTVQYVMEMYAASDFDLRIYDEITPDNDFQLAMTDWATCCAQKSGAIADLSIRLSDFLDTVEAEFPGYVMSRETKWR